MAMAWKPASGFRFSPRISASIVGGVRFAFFHGSSSAWAFSARLRLLRIMSVTRVRARSNIMAKAALHDAGAGGTHSRGDLMTSW